MHSQAVGCRGYRLELAEGLIGGFMSHGGLCEEGEQSDR